MRGLLSYSQITSSLVRSFSPARNLSRALLIIPFSSRITSHRPHLTRLFSVTLQSKMSFSNTDTGDKNADPYKEKNLDEPPLKEKIDDLVNFISTSKFGMLTTRVGSTGLLASRCMSVAAKVKLAQLRSPKSPNSHLPSRDGWGWGIFVCHFAVSVAIMPWYARVIVINWLKAY